MRKTRLCRTAMVELSKKSTEHKWGLCNGALGAVMGIIFRIEENPNNGDLPLVVVVEFKHNQGHIWDTHTIQHMYI
jgi:hypothetical protein